MAITRRFARTLLLRSEKNGEFLTIDIDFPPRISSNDVREYFQNFLYANGTDYPEFVASGLFETLTIGAQEHGPVHARWFLKRKEVEALAEMSWEVAQHLNRRNYGAGPER